MEILKAIESSAFVTWVGSNALFAYTGLIFCHAVGLAFAVGVSAVIDLRILGVAPGLPLAPMEKLFPVMWMGFGLNVLSGIPLLMANATNDLVNPTFYAKMTFIVLAVVSVRRIKNQVFRGPASVSAMVDETRGLAERDRITADGTAVVATLDPSEAAGMTAVGAMPLPVNAKRLAIASLAFWTLAIVAGRLCEYPNLLGFDWVR